MDGREGTGVTIGASSDLALTATPVPGAFLLNPDCKADNRGFFARTWCERAAQALGLNSHVAQCSVSFNHSRGTLRGMHYQAAPYAEAKLVRCTRGSIYDVAVDLRPQSPAFMQYFAAELSAENRRSLYIPEGCAHGFLTLEDNTEVLYQISEFYAPEAARGFRWDDPSFGIAWPQPVSVISERDRTYPDFHGDRIRGGL